MAGIILPQLLMIICGSPLASGTLKILRIEFTCMPIIFETSEQLHVFDDGDRDRLQRIHLCS